MFRRIGIRRISQRQISDQSRASRQHRGLAKRVDLIEGHIRVRASKGQSRCRRSYPPGLRQRSSRGHRQARRRIRRSEHRSLVIDQLHRAAREGHRPRQGIVRSQRDGIGSGVDVARPHDRQRSTLRHLSARGHRQVVPNIERAKGKRTRVNRQIPAAGGGRARDTQRIGPGIQQRWARGVQCHGLVARRVRQSCRTADKRHCPLQSVVRSERDGIGSAAAASIDGSRACHRQRSRLGHWAAGNQD